MDEYVLVSCVSLIIHHESELWEWLATRIELNVCVRKCVFAEAVVSELCVVCVIFLFRLLVSFADLQKLYFNNNKKEQNVCVYVRWLTTMEFFVSCMHSKKS